MNEAQSVTGFPVSESLSLHCNRYEKVTEKDSFTSEQWDNLVKVASIIKANEARLDMSCWHQTKGCGTCHCIAGWAECLSRGDTNYLSPKEEPLNLARSALSIYSEPFFWVTRSNLFSPLQGLAERLVMKWFIDPILEEAREDSYVLSTEFTKFLEETRKGVTFV